jgi:CHASE2 domain-containing sensor protein
MECTFYFAAAEHQYLDCPFIPTYSPFILAIQSITTGIASSFLRFAITRKRKKITFNYTKKNCTIHHQTRLGVKTSHVKLTIFKDRIILAGHICTSLPDIVANMTLCASIS